MLYFSFKWKDNRSVCFTLQDYSMDCYFRQYWRDKRLSFKSPIKSLSLSIKVRPKVLHDVNFKSVLLHFCRCWSEYGDPTHTSTMRRNLISTQLPFPISCFGCLTMVTFSTQWGNVLTLKIFRYERSKGDDIKDTMRSIKDMCTSTLSELPSKARWDVVRWREKVDKL